MPWFKLIHVNNRGSWKIAWFCTKLSNCLVWCALFLNWPSTDQIGTNEWLYGFCIIRVITVHLRVPVNCASMFLTGSLSLEINKHGRCTKYRSTFLRFPIHSCTSLAYIIFQQWLCRLYLIDITATSNDRHGVSNYRSIECLFDILLRLKTNKHKRSALPSLCVGKPLVTSGSKIQ